MKCKLVAFGIAVASLTMAGHFAEAKTSASPAHAAEKSGQDELALFRASLRLDRRDFVKKAMALNQAQGKKFWGLYYQYEADMMKLNDQRLAIIKDYEDGFDTMSDAQAGELVKRSLEFRQERGALLEKYYDKISKVTSKFVGARFLQVESVLQGAGDVAVGSSLPLMPKNR